MNFDSIKEHKKAILLAVLVVLIVVIIIILIATGIILNNGDSDDASGFSSNKSSFVGTKHSKEEYKPLLQFFYRNRKFRADLRRLKKYDVYLIKNEYQQIDSYLKQHPGLVNQRICNGVRDTLYHIQINDGNFEIIDTIPFRELEIYIENMDRSLYNLFDSLGMLIGSNLTEDMKFMRDKYVVDDPYKHVVDSACAGESQLSKQIIDDMHYDNYIYNNNGFTDTTEWLDLNTPSNAKSQYDMKREQGRIKPFNGCFEDMTREVDRQIVDTSPVDEDRRGTDTRYPKLGVMSTEFNDPTVSDYRGRQNVYTYT